MARSTQVFRSVMRNRSLRRVLAGFFLFNAQEYAVWIAVIVYAFEHGGTATVGVVLVAQLVPAAAVAPFTAVLGDRLRRDTALSLGYLIQAIACGLLAVALWKAPPLVAYAAAVLASCAVTFTRPAHYAILPGLADTPEELTAANAATSMMEGLGTLVGPGLNAVLIVAIGPGGVIGVMAVAMGAATVLVSRLRLYRDVERDAGAVPESFIQDALAGFQELRRDRGAALLLCVGGSQFFLIGLLDVFFALLAIEILDAGSSGAGVLAAGFGAGGLIGATAAVALASRRRLSPAMVGGLSASGIALAAVGLAETFALALLLIAAVGAARAFFDVAARTLLQRAVRDDVLARVFGVEEGLQMLGLAAGSAAAPFFVSVFGPRGAFVAAGVLLLVVVVLTWPRIGTVDAAAMAPGPGLALLRSVRIFAPLPEHVAEQLSWHLIPLPVAAGTVVIREGDAGDRYYLVAEGTLAVTVGAETRRELGPGSSFGEIALLRDVPRTATVTALTDCRLLALDRDVFLQAVTGSRRSVRAAGREVDRHLGRRRN
ncbi:MAG: MFS transporter [Actinomycetota bacterium]